MEKSTGILKVKWNVGGIILLFLLIALSALGQLLVDAPSFPLYFDYFGILIGACIGGPLYGVLVAVGGTLVQLLLGGSIVSEVFLLEEIAVAVFMGIYVRMGFFGKKRGVILGVFLCAILQAFLRTSIHFTIFGVLPEAKNSTSAIFFFFWNKGAAAPIANFLSYFIMDFIDKAITMYGIYALLKYFPKNLADKFGINTEIPVAVIVATAADEEFLAESDRLRAKAQEKIDKKKEETTNG